LIRADALKLLYAPALLINDQTAKSLIFKHKAAFVCLFVWKNTKHTKQKFRQMTLNQLFG